MSEMLFYSFILKKGSTVLVILVISCRNSLDASLTFLFRPVWMHKGIIL